MNDSGIEPTEYRCVVKLDPVDDRTAGGLYLPDQNIERNQMSSTHGTLIAVGGMAFHEWDGHDWRPWKGTVPKVGDRVVVNKYAGQFREADPKDLYRIVNDKEIVGVAREMMNRNEKGRDDASYKRAKDAEGAGKS